MGESWCAWLNVSGFFRYFVDRILDFCRLCGGVRGKVNSAFDRVRRVLSWSLLLRLWSRFCANPEAGYPRSPVRNHTTTQLLNYAISESFELHRFHYSSSQLLHSTTIEIFKFPTTQLLNRWNVQLFNSWQVNFSTMQLLNFSKLSTTHLFNYSTIQ